ncbi:MAG: phasin family protein [Alphaproteobacteria bacterium]
MAKNTSDPFFDFTKAFGDYSKMFADAKLPGFDMQGIMVAQQKNIEAMTAANRRAFAGMQALAQRQSEILKEVMEESAAAMQELMATGQPQEKMVRQAELVRESMERAMTHMRELSEMVATSNSETIEIVSKRVQEAMDEMRKIAAKS